MSLSPDDAVESSSDRIAENRPRSVLTARDRQFFGSRMTPMAMATVSSTLLGLASIGFPVSVTRRPSMGPLTAMRSA